MSKGHIVGPPLPDRVIVAGQLRLRREGVTSRLTVASGQSGALQLTVVLTDGQALPLWAVTVILASCRAATLPPDKSIIQHAARAAYLVTGGVVHQAQVKGSFKAGLTCYRRLKYRIHMK